MLNVEDVTKDVDVIIYLIHSIPQQLSQGIFQTSIFTLPTACPAAHKNKVNNLFK